MYEHILYIAVGDPSGDGHSYREEVYFTSNLPADEFSKAYKNGCKKLEFKPHELCVDYGEDDINKETYDYIVSLQTNGLLDKELDLSYILSEPDDDFSTDEKYVHFYGSYGLVELILAVARSGNPALKCTLIEGTPVLREYSIGYGLY